MQVSTYRLTNAHCLLYSGESFTFKQDVVAALDNQDICRQDARPDTSSISLAQPFKLVAKYDPSATVLFRMTISLPTKPDKTIIYLQFTSEMVTLLHQSAWGNKDGKANSSQYFKAIQSCLNGPRSFIRLQFRLSNHCQLIVPHGFDGKDLYGEAHLTFATVTSLASANNFSLYMKHHALPGAYYNSIFKACDSSSALTEAQRARLAELKDPRMMYGGKGGKIFCTKDQDAQSTRVYDENPHQSTILPRNMVLKHPRSPQRPDQRLIPLPHLPHRPTERIVKDSIGFQPTVKVCMLQPPIECPITSTQHAHFSRSSLICWSESCGKRGLSIESDSFHHVIGRKRQATHVLSQPQFFSAGLGPHEVLDCIQTLQVTVHKLQATVHEQAQHIGRLNTEIKVLEDRIEGVEENEKVLDNTVLEVKSQVETNQEEMAEQLEVMSADVHELRQGVESVTECLEERVKESVDSMVDENVLHIAMEAVVKFKKEFEENLVESLTKTCRSTNSTS